MNTYYYYASPAMTRFTEPQDELTAACSLTEQMIRWVVFQCAAGKPPFRAFIPRFVAWEFATWKIPPDLISVQIVTGKPEDDVSPCDVARILFDDCEAQIICRRSIPLDCTCS